ncbi:MAG: acyl-CoA desaturase [Polyangiaceae bacterium]
MTTAASGDAPLCFQNDAERFKKFGEEIDAIRERIEAKVGDEDVAYIKRLNRFSRGMEVIGRVLIHFSFEPISFTSGVLALWVHKQLQATEIGHTALHGAYDKLPGAEGFCSKTFSWDTPIDEESWRAGHNIRHHGNTNVAGRDPDIHFGPVRLTEHTPYTLAHKFQLLFTLFVLFPNFGALMNTHFTGLNDIWAGNGRSDQFDFVKDRSWASVKEAYWKAFRKYVPYYAKNYVLFPLLAGPGFFKVLAGNWLAETLRDIYSAATIYCGHVGPETSAFPEGTRSHSRGEWYAMQAEATNNFSVPHLVSVLCGGLDLQIEHHLFPKLPPERLREIAPEIRAVCEKYGVSYRSESWGKTLRLALSHIANLSHQDIGAFSAVRRVAREVA